MRTVAILQARMGSTRLPGKVLADLAGQTVIGRTIERTRASGAVDEVVIATTESPYDDAVVREAERLGCAHFRGSEEDVLARYLGAARQFRAEVVVRIACDCPLLDPKLTGVVIERLGQADYASNAIRRTFPIGVDVEALTRQTLERVAQIAVAPREREHVTLYIAEHSNEFRCVSVESDIDLSAHRWTIDTPEDLALVKAIYEHFSPRAVFSMQEVLSLLDGRPDLVQLNAHIRQHQA